MADTFVINDRRGQKKETSQDEHVTHVQPEENTDKSSWKEITYAIALMNVHSHPQQPPQTMVVGRAVGLRSDGKPFIADYFLPPVWPEGLDWPKWAKKRLDTFLGCGCIESAPCPTHKLYLPQWQQADMERLASIAQEPAPEPIVVLLTAEKARQSRLVIPGRR